VSVVVPDGIGRFKGVVQIYPNKEDVREYNRTELRDLGRPVIMINDALHEGKHAEKASTEKAGNLPASVHPTAFNRCSHYVA
jgi:hypothetical protein